MRLWMSDKKNNLAEKIEKVTTTEFLNKKKEASRKIKEAAEKAEKDLEEADKKESEANQEPEDTSEMIVGLCEYLRGHKTKKAKKETVNIFETHCFGKRTKKYRAAQIWPTHKEENEKGATFTDWVDYWDEGMPCKRRGF